MSGARPFRFTDSQWGEVLGVLETAFRKLGRIPLPRPSSESIQGFRVTLELDVDDWLKGETTERSAQKRGRGRPSYKARRQLTDRLAHGLWDGLGLRPGAGTVGPFVSLLSLCLKAGGVHIADASSYTKAAAIGAKPDDEYVRGLLIPKSAEVSGFKHDLSDRKQAKKKFSKGGRKSATHKGKR